MKPKVVATIAEVRAAVAEARRAGKTIGCVPTMGALHEGHAALVRAAKKSCEYVVVTVFVNPTQFGPNEDFAKYPRTLETDVELSGEAGADLVFAPTPDEVYAKDSTTFVEVTKLGDHLCGPRRPGHFRGVCTVVLKLFNIVLPDVAVFGAKDAQQARIILRMVRDLNSPVRIQIEPTIRESDGLAMSSRNRYLSVEERKLAPRIYAALLDLRARAAAGEIDVARLESSIHATLSSISGARVDYAQIVDDESLQPIARLERPALCAVAVFLGSTRLIDNITLP